MNTKFVKLFIRIAMGITFLSACADRFGFWSEEVQAWGNMNAFYEYTHQLMPWLSFGMAKAAGLVATICEVVFGICLLIGLKVKLVANLSGIMLLMFGFAMMTALSVKAPLDYSVFVAAGACFALASINEKYMEIY